MRSLRLLNDEIRGHSTLDLLRAAVGNAGAKGLSVADVRRRCRVLDALDRADGAERLILEDADAKVLGECVRVMPWTVVDPRVVAFVDAVEGMPEHHAPLQVPA